MPSTPTTRAGNTNLSPALTHTAPDSYAIEEEVPYLASLTTTRAFRTRAHNDATNAAGMTL